MRVRSASALALATGLLVPAVSMAPAFAGNTLAITVTPDHARLAESFTVNGSGGCASKPYTVTFTYTNHDGDPQASNASGTTDGQGGFSQEMTVPETATAGEAANVQASVDCNATTSPSQSPSPSPSATNQGLTMFGGPTTSNTVAFTIDFYDGVLSISKNSGKPGDVITVSGTLCYGGDALVLFTNGDAADEVTVTVNPTAHTFTGTYTLPNAPGGTYAFVAECPGTHYADRAFTLVNDSPSASPLPPAPPAGGVGGTVDFTG